MSDDDGGGNIDDSTDDFKKFVSYEKSRQRVMRPTSSSTSNTRYEKRRQLDYSISMTPVHQRHHRGLESGTRTRNQELLADSADSNSRSRISVSDKEDDGDESMEIITGDETADGNVLNMSDASVHVRRNTRFSTSNQEKQKSYAAEVPVHDSKFRTFLIDENVDDEVMEVTIGSETTDPNSSNTSGTDTFQSPTIRRSARSHMTEKERKQSSGGTISLPDAASSSFETDDEEEDEHRDDRMRIKVNQEGDGTNNSLQMLTEVDIIHSKENRQIRQNTDPADIFVQSNPERYFLAGTRVKYKTVVEAPSTPAGMKKAKKPRKGNRTGRTPGDNLPEKSISNFSVSTEIAKINILEWHNSMEKPKHEDDIDALQKDMAKDFPRWQYILRENFNILLYGYGSKEPILKNFKSFLNDEFLVVEVNGLFPKLNPRKLLLGFWEALELDESLPSSGNNILAIAEDMYNILNVMDHPSIFFFIHNMERLAYKLPKLFKVLCCLSRIKFIHLIATVDHINTGLGIGHIFIVELNLFWINCTSFAPYEKELTWKEGAFNGGQEEETSKSSLDQVLKSLTANARKAFAILVSLQLKSMKAGGQSKQKKFEGIKFLDLLRKCREAFVAHGEMPLRTLLTEFVDHKLIRYAGKGKKADNLLVVDLEIGILEQIIV